MDIREPAGNRAPPYSAFNAYSNPFKVKVLEQGV